MHHLSGTYRSVLVFPKIGIVIKFPNIMLKRAWKEFLSYIPGRHFKLMGKYFCYGIEVECGFKNLVFKGIRDNYYERKFYKETKQLFLQPTYCSLFGLVNIQKYGIIHEGPEISLFLHFSELMNQEAIKDGHHFTHWHNFCFVDGKIRIVDYGDQRTQQLITKWGEKVVTGFNLQKALVPRHHTGT